MDIKKYFLSIFLVTWFCLLNSCVYFNTNRGPAFEVLPSHAYQSLRPEPQEFNFDPARARTIQGKHGSIIIIPANAFALPADYKKGSKIKFIIHEATTPAAVLGTGLNLDFKGSILQSSGMIRLNAFHNNRHLALNKNLSLKMPANKDPRDYNVYSYTDNRWNLEGHNQEVMGEDPGSVSETSALRFRLFLKINKLAWWNFDYPKPGIICLKGHTNGRSANLYYVSVIGMDYTGVYSNWFSGDSFEINAPASSNIKILINNDTTAFGSSAVIKTWDKPGFMYSKSKQHSCQEVPTILLHNYSDEYIKQTSLQKILGLP